MEAAAGFCKRFEEAKPCALLEKGINENFTALKDNPLSIWQLSVLRGNHASEVGFIPGRDTDAVGVLLSLIVN